MCTYLSTSLNVDLFCDCLQGTVFFPLPDGTGLLFTVSGTAEPPKMNGGAKIQNDIPCKVPYVEHLPVENWLKRPQRYKNMSGQLLLFYLKEIK